MTPASIFSCVTKGKLTCVWIKGELVSVSNTGYAHLSLEDARADLRLLEV